jgi:uncharacterized protein YbjQ (UPF0145 family)
VEKEAKTPVKERSAPPEPVASDQKKAKPQASEWLSTPPYPMEEKTKTPVPQVEKPVSTKKGQSQDGVQEKVQVKLEQLERLIVTTTSVLEGKFISAYHGIVSATVFVRGDLVKERLDNATGDVISIRSSSLDGPLEKARTVALTDLKVEAAKQGANAVVGLTMSQTPGIGGMWLYLVGTAVTLKE